VICQLDMLRSCVTLPALRKALKSLPNTLDETYERILTNIDESYVSDVQKILRFLTFSPRLLSLTQLVEVLAVDLDGEEPQFDPENRIPEQKDIVAMCSSLVTTSELDGFLYVAQDTPILRLAHFSVKEYLLSERIKSSKASMYSMDPTSGNLLAARTYITYLLGPQFSDGHCGWENFESRCISWPLFRAAVILWPIHTATADEHIDTWTKELVQKLLSSRQNTNGGNYAAWIGGLIPEVDSQTILKTPPLYYAASFGMVSVVKLLLSDTPMSDIDVKGGRASATPLHVACFRGQAKVVKLLLEAGADPNTTNFKGESCLYWARNHGALEDMEIEGLLLKYGARDELSLEDCPAGKIAKPKDEMDYCKMQLKAEKILAGLDDKTYVTSAGVHMNYTHGVWYVDKKKTAEHKERIFEDSDLTAEEREFFRPTSSPFH
jgi:hypothetical protein